MKKRVPRWAPIIVVITLIHFSCSSNTVQPETNKEEKDSIVVVLPEVETMPVKDITVSSALGGGKVLQDGGGEITRQGICWDTVPEPTIEDHTAGLSSISGSGIFTCSLTDLKDTTLYYVRAYAANSAGIAYGKEVQFITRALPHSKSKEMVWTDSVSFKNYQAFEEEWDYLYPWGPDHNGSARMYAGATDHSQVFLKDDVLIIKADRITKDEGKSTADPHLQIKYHSGAVHLKKQIRIDNDHPYWVISGDFKVPYTKGCWPAFWITGASSWPPESDIMEFKGSNSCWQNTAQGPDWKQVSWQNAISEVAQPDEWHNYKVIIQKVSSTDVNLIYYIDGKATGTHTADFVNKPFWLIINLQMEGSSGSPGPQEAVMYAKNVRVSSWPQ